MNTDELMVEAINLARKNLIEWQEYGEALKNQLDAANAKLSERKTVHEWLNAKGTPREENGKPLYLLRRLAIALGIHDGLKVRPDSGTRWAKATPPILESNDESIHPETKP